MFFSLTVAVPVLLQSLQMWWKWHVPLQILPTASFLACTNMSFTFSLPLWLHALSSLSLPHVCPCMLEYAALWISGCPHEQRMYPNPLVSLSAAVLIVCWEKLVNRWTEKELMRNFCQFYWHLKYCLLIFLHAARFVHMMNIIISAHWTLC